MCKKRVSTILYSCLVGNGLGGGRETQSSNQYSQKSSLSILSLASRFRILHAHLTPFAFQGPVATFRLRELSLPGTRSSVLRLSADYGHMILHLRCRFAAKRLSLWHLPLLIPGNPLLAWRRQVSERDRLCIIAGSVLGPVENPGRRSLTSFLPSFCLRRQKETACYYYYY